MTLTVAFDYGGRSELVSAVEKARKGADGITTDSISRQLYLPGPAARRRPRAH